MKKMKITRKVLNAHGHSKRVEDKVFTNNIKPGWKSGSKITLPKDAINIRNEYLQILYFSRTSHTRRSGGRSLSVRYSIYLSYRTERRSLWLHCGSSYTARTVHHVKVGLYQAEYCTKDPRKGPAEPKGPGHFGDPTVQFDVEFPSKPVTDLVLREQLMRILPPLPHA